MPRSIKNLLLSEKYPDDQPVLDLINELRTVVPGVRAKDAFKNFCLRFLPNHIAKERENGGRLAGDQS